MSTAKFNQWLNPDGTENYKCRAWVVFNSSGTGTPVIGASGNIASITDNGTGDYTLNFSAALPDTNYSHLHMGTTTTGTHVSLGIIPSKSTSALRFTTPDAAGTKGDWPYVSAAIFR